MAWIYLEKSTDSPSSLESEDSTLHSMNGCGQSPIAKSIHIVKESCFQGWRIVTSLHVPYGTIYEHLIQVNGDKQSISFTEDFLAKTLALQDLEKAWMESEADFFTKSSGCVAAYSQNLSSWKMFPSSVLGVEKIWSENLPKSGMTVDGVLYPLQISEHITKEKGFFSWPSPNNPFGHLKIMYMPTPTASQAGKPIRHPSPSRLKGKHGWDLQDFVGYIRPETIGKKISVEWIGMIMGFPLKWTELDPWVIQYVRSKQKKRSKF